MFTKEEQKIIDDALAIMEAKAIYKGGALTSPEITSKYLRNYLRLKHGAEKNESFGIIFLDNRHRIIETEIMFRGTIDGVSVYIRPIIEKVLQYGAAAVILFHNHPSGIAEPSNADIRITDRVREALGYVDTRVLDHLVVGSEGSVSMAERGLM